MRIFVFLIGFLIFLLVICSYAGSNDFQVSSSAFEPNTDIPKKYTCDGGDVNPPLKFKNVPSKAKSLALTVTDPDAPEGVWSHWVIYNIPPNTGDIIENTNPGTEGLSDFGKYVYGGPCPSDDKLHHYVFRAYALDNVLYINEGSSISEVEKAIRWHVISKTELIGTYQKSAF
jgi:Raf kinase inhibitor-like YbhB/YbcL family protein